jgi:hypothetical protein
MTTTNITYRTFYLNDKKSRWINVDTYGNKDKIVLSTTSGKLITRTCQYWGKFFLGDDAKSIVLKTKITYKGKIYFVTPNTILED